MRRAILGVLLFVFAAAPAARAADDFYPWTVLTPQNDTRDPDVREQDEYESRTLVDYISQTEEAFHHRLVWNKVALPDLLSTSTTFCELRFDAVKPFVPTDREKAVLREYFLRGGFVMLLQDCYPYSEDQFWAVHQWPIIDFLKELPKTDHDFTVQKITDANPLFRQYYVTSSVEFLAHEMAGNPSTPNRTALFYRGHICAFVYGHYGAMINGKWAAYQRPFGHSPLNRAGRGYQLTVNLYIYVMMH